MKKFLTTIWMLALCQFLLAGGDTIRLSLKEAVDYAMQHNPQIRTSEKDMLIARQKVWETTGIGLPQLNSEFNFQNNIKRPTTVIPANAFNPAAPDEQLIPVQFGTNYNATLNISASQLIFDGTYIVGLQASRTYQQLSEIQYAKNQDDIKSQIEQAYTTCLLADNYLLIADSALSSTLKIFEDSKEMYKLGIIDKTTLQQAEINYLNAKNMSARAHRQKETAYMILNLHLGNPVNTPLHLTQTLDELISEAKEYPGQLLNVNFNPEQTEEFKTAETQELLMKLNLKKEKFSFLPSLGAFYTHQEQAFRNKFNFFDSNQSWFPADIWGINVKFPILKGGMRLAKMSQARLDWQKAGIMKENVSNTLQLQFQSAKNDFISALDELNKQEKNATLAKEIYLQTVEKYKNGTASGMELNQTYTQWMMAYSSYLAASMEVLNKKSTLENILN